MGHAASDQNTCRLSCEPSTFRRDKFLQYLLLIVYLISTVCRLHFSLLSHAISWSVPAN